MACLPGGKTGEWPGPARKGLMCHVSLFSRGVVSESKLSFGTIPRLWQLPHQVSSTDLHPSWSLDTWLFYLLFTLKVIHILSWINEDIQVSEEKRWRNQKGWTSGKAGEPALVLSSFCLPVSSTPYSSPLLPLLCHVLISSSFARSAISTLDYSPHAQIPFCLGVLSLISTAPPVFVLLPNCLWW